MFNKNKKHENFEHGLAIYKFLTQLKSNIYINNFDSFHPSLAHIVLSARRRVFSYLVVSNQHVRINTMSHHILSVEVAEPYKRRRGVKCKKLF